MRAILVVVVAALASGCMMGPDYSRPPVELPAAHRVVEGEGQWAAGFLPLWSP